MKTILILLSASAAIAQQALYGQCAGLIWGGPYTCVAGTVCTYFNDYYSQCLPGIAISSSSSLASSTSTKSSSSPSQSSSKTTSTGTIKTLSSTSTTKLSTLTTSTRSPTITSTLKSSSLTSSSKSTARTSTTSSVVVVTVTDFTTRSTTVTTTSKPSTTATLSSGYYWIRAVESPNFHSYLQTLPTGVPGSAILSSYTTAGQFQIVSGQLVQTTPSGFLYANVENPSNITGYVKLGMSFNTTQNTFGTFAFSGDAVIWSVPTVSRPNLSAWLVCQNQELYINLGNYAYLTPAGCVDETIHYYNDATANGP